VARIGEMTNECGAEVDKSQRKIHLDDMRRWLSKCILNKAGKALTGFIQEHGQVAGCCEQGNEP